MTDLAPRLRAGDRRALAKAITLIESTRADHREQADALLTGLMPATGHALRVDFNDNINFTVKKASGCVRAHRQEGWGGGGPGRAAI